MKFLLGIMLIVVSWLVMSWALMLFIGVLHHELSPAIPAIGFWPAARIEIALSLVLGVWMTSHEIGKEVAK